MRLHQDMAAKGERVLVINYADLLWRGNDTIARLQRFLPCAGPLDITYVPQLGIDVFEGNTWKVEGSVRDYARKYDPVKHCGYNVDTGSCEWWTNLRIWGTSRNAIPIQMRERLKIVHRYFLPFSRI